MVNMGNVWDRTAEFLSDNLASVMPVALLAIFVPTSIMSNLQGLLPNAPLVGKLALLAAILVLALITGWGQLMVTALTLELPADGRFGKLALSRLPASVLVSITLGVLVALLLTPIPVMAALGGFNLATLSAGETSNINLGFAAGIAGYELLLFVVGLWLASRLTVISPVIVAEGSSLGAIGRSWQLTRGASLKIVGVLILYIVVGIVASLAATLVFGSVFKLVVGRGDGGVSLASVLTTIVVGVVQTGFVVVAAVFVAQLYRALHPDTAGSPA